MHKKIAILAAIILGLTLTAKVSAAGLVNLRLEQPKTPTGLNEFNLTFVALDTDNTESLVVKCFKQGPSDPSMVQFGGDISVTAGGNTGYCPVTSSLFNDDGTYNFKAELWVNSVKQTDASTSIVYDTKGPGDPKDWNKTKSGCNYTIHFKTADDSGATVKTEIYRSDSTSFSADSGTRIGTVYAGSNEAHDYNDTPADCSKNYYYAVRSFDTAGNGSGVIGDSEIHTTTTTILVSPTPGVGAIPVSGNVLGQEATGNPSPTGEVKGDTTPSAEVVNLKPTTGLMQALTSLLKNRTFWIVVVLVLGGIWYARRKKS